MSLFVPHVFSSITKEKVATVFNKFGDISRIDIVPKKTGNNAVYIRFTNWYDTEDNRVFQQQLTTGDYRCQLPYDEKWFWIVLENKRVHKTMPPKTPPPSSKSNRIPGAPKKKKQQQKQYETYDLVDAKYVYYMECEVMRLTELVRKYEVV